MLGEREPASPSCSHSEARDGGPALHDDVLPGVIIKEAVQLHRDVEQEGRLHQEFCEHSDKVEKLAWLTKASEVLAARFHR